MLQTVLTALRPLLPIILEVIAFLFVTVDLYGKERLGNLDDRIKKFNYVPFAGGRMSLLDFLSTVWIFGTIGATEFYLLSLVPSLGLGNELVEFPFKFIIILFPTIFISVMLLWLMRLAGIAMIRIALYLLDKRGLEGTLILVGTFLFVLSKSLEAWDVLAGGRHEH